MTSLSEGEFLLPLFPLPNLVFFPQTRLPLHVFESRYRQLIADVIGTDQRFGIVLLRPGFEDDYFGAPPLYACGTVAHVEQSVTLDDGTRVESHVSHAEALPRQRDFVRVAWDPAAVATLPLPK